MNQNHTAHHTVKQIQDFKLEVLPHPPYLPDLAPSDFHLFWPLKDALLVRNFRSDEEVEERERD
jgi:histone-lysine N-methyltransferase SETMAR